MGSKQKSRYPNEKPAYVSQPDVITLPTLPPTVEHAVRPELMTFDLAGQRARDLEIIRLLNEILKAMSDGK